VSVPFRALRYDVVSGGASDPRVVSGIADPSSGGVAAPEGSLFLRFVGGAGEVYFKTAGADTDWTAVGAGGGASTLDDAYDGGGAGVGRTITADAGAVVMTTAAADNNNVLEIVKNPAGPQSGVGLSVSMGAFTTGAGLSVVQLGAGPSVLTSNGTAASPAWKFAGSAGGLFQSSTNILQVSDGTNAVATWDATGAVTLAPAASSSGIQETFRVNGAIHTGITASTENPDVIFNLQRTVTYATGALTQHRAAIVLAPTLAFGGNSIVDDASTWYIAGPPVEGGFATITNPAALHVDAGVSRLDDGVEFIERAAATRSMPSGRGLLWVRQDSPSVIVFTDDTNVDTVLGASTGNTLDGAYDEGGVGAGRTINATDGAVIIQNTSSADTNNMLEISKTQSGGDRAGNLINLTNNVFHTGDMIAAQFASNSGNVGLACTQPSGSSTTNQALTWTETTTGVRPVIEISRFGLSAVGPAIRTTHDAITTETDYSAAAIVMQNTTFATAGNPKYSPAIALRGQGHDGGDSQQLTWLIQNRPVDAASSTELHFSAETAFGIGFTSVMNLNEVGDLSIAGKLTVAGLIDPTGLVLDEQATVPGGTPTGSKATLWVRNDATPQLVLTDDTGADTDVGSGGGGGVSAGGGSERSATFSVPEGAGTVEATLGRAIRRGSVIGLSVQLEDAVTAGTVTVNVKVNAGIVMTAVLNTTDTISKITTSIPGEDPLLADDEITVEVVTAGFTNAATAATGLTVNVLLTGATEPVVAGGGSLVFVDSKTVEGAATGSVVFTGLDGNADTRYMLEAYIVNDDQPTLRTFTLRPNGLTTNQDSQRLASGGAATTSSDEVDLTIAKFSGTDMWQIIDIMPVTTHRRAVISRGASMTAAPDSGAHFYTGVWNETVTNITSLEINEAVSSGIGVGSFFRLFKIVESPEIVASAGGVYERHASFGVAVGASTQEATVGRIQFPGSLIGLSAHLELPVTAGTIDINVKVNTVTKLTATLNTTDTEVVFDTGAVGLHALSQSDEVTVEAVATGYDNSGSLTSGLVVNASFAAKVAIDPVVDASDTVTGITRLSVAPVSTPIAYGSNDPAVARTDTSQTFTKAQGSAISTLSNGANIAVDASLSNSFELAIDVSTGQLDNPTNLVAGFTYLFRVVQLAPGGFTLTFDTAYKFEGAAAPTITIGPGAVDLITGFCPDGSTLECAVIQDLQ
jgi:hypothetical protein